MSTAITALIEEKHDIYLADCVREILDWHQTGILKGGKVRGLADEVVAISNSPEYKLRMAEDLVLKEAAKRFMQHIYFDID